MSKLSRKANARVKIDENLVFLPVINSLFTLSLVILLAGVAWADEKITKSHGFNSVSYTHLTLPTTPYV